MKSTNTTAENWPESLTVQHALSEIKTLKQVNILRNKSQGIPQSSYQASNIPTMTMEDKTATHCTYHPVDADQEALIIPGYLKGFLFGLFSIPENGELFNRVIMLMQSFS